MQSPVTYPTTVVYRDKWARMIGIPLIAAFSHYLTYNNTKLDWILVSEFLSDSFKIALVWQVVRWVVVRLDGVLPWQGNFVKRLLVQYLLTSTVGSAALTALVLSEYNFIRNYPLEHFYDFDLVIANIFILLGNVVYVSLYFYDVALQGQAQRQQLEAKLKEQPVPEVDYLMVRIGKSEQRVPFASILCAYSEDKETYLLHENLKTYVLDLSLDQLEKQLPGTQFFRANRQFILSPKAMASVAADTNGKLLVQLSTLPKLPEKIGVSRLKAPTFRQWLKR